jgi:predicted metalloendopeptidase
MNFPAGVLQAPLFDLKMDDAPNYGNTGGTIGHELTHGFDDEGRQFDAKGNLKDWWTKKDADEFVKRATCISDQYSQYTVVDDVKINGKLTLGEDVADGRPDSGLQRVEERHRGKEAGTYRRLHPGAAFLYRLRTVGLRRRTPRKQTRQRHHQPAFPGGVSH